MKKIISLIMYIILCNGCFAQSSDLNNKQQIEDLLQTFMKSIEVKDSITMYSLFADVPVTWVGVYKPMTQQARNKIDTSASAYKIFDYKTWFRNVSRNGQKSELFSNPVIVEDGTIGSVTFDYSFWINGKKGNWGKESWGLIKVDDTWKIASVIFSMELEKIKKQPEEICGQTEIQDKDIEKYVQSFVTSNHFQGAVLVAKGDSVVHNF